MRKRRFLALGLAMTMTLSLMAPGTAAASNPSDEERQAQIALAQGEKDDQGNVTKAGELPGTTRTFFDENDDIRDYFNASGFAAAGVQDRSEYYDEYVANGKKPTKNYKVVEEDGYIHKQDGTYLTEKEYNKLDESAKANYTYKVAERQFIEALSSGAPVIQVNALELELGFHYLEDNLDFPYDSVISPVTDYQKSKLYHAPQTNPLIMHKDDTLDAGQDNSQFTGAGISGLDLYDHLTLFSTTGCKIRHAGLDLNKNEDIIIRNFAFEGMYEWDDLYGKISRDPSGKLKPADYTTRKRYGWCNISCSSSKNIWIDHCTLGFAYDGNVDLSNGSQVSITWCQLGEQDLDVPDEELATDEEGYLTTTWDESQGCELWKNILYMEEFYKKFEKGQTDGYGYQEYTKYREAGITPQQIFRYAALHSKVHLCGSGESSFYTNVDTKISLGYNYYTNVMQRIPMVRQGNGHMYNCIVDNMEYNENAKKLQAKGFSVYCGSISVNNARDGASIGSDTCIYKDVDPSSGVERQGQEGMQKGVKDEWNYIIAPMINHNLVVNSQIIKPKSDGTEEVYTGSTWDNNGENPLTKDWKWDDIKPKQTLGDFKWSKWKNQDQFAQYFAQQGIWDGVESAVFDYCGNGADWTKYYNDFYEGTDELGYDYQCFELDKLEKMLVEYGGAHQNLYGTDETMKDYIQPYNQKSAEKEYSKKVLVDTANGTIEGKANNIYLVKEDESITLPTGSAITRKGYEFTGWKKGTYNETAGKWEFNAEPVMEVTITGDNTFSEEYYLATWESEKYTVTFDSMGGSPVLDILRDELNQSFRNALAAVGKSDFPTSTKEGATFLGWYPYDAATKTYGTKYILNSKITGNMTLYARWKNTIQFNTNGGSAVEAKTVDSGNKLSGVSEPTKEGYTFDGWYTDEALTTPFNADEAIMEPMTLYANWKEDENPVPDTVTITFETNGGTTMAAIEVEKGATAGAIAVPEKSESAFAGWYTDEALATPFDPDAALDTDVKLYAAWLAMGDLDEIGGVTPDDALLVLQSLAGKIKLTPKQILVGDIDGIGGITPDDALYILQRVAGKLTSFDEVKKK